MWTPSSDTSPGAHAVQLGLLRRAGPTRRVDLCFRLSAEVIEMSRRALHQARSHLTEQEILLEWVAINYGNELAEALRDRV